MISHYLPIVTQNSSHNCHVVLCILESVFDKKRWPAIKSFLSQCVICLSTLNPNSSENVRVHLLVKDLRGMFYSSGNMS